MIAELGHFALILAAVVALVQSIVPLIGAAQNRAGWVALAPAAATAQFVLTALSFAALTYAFVVSDFSLQLVVFNSHSLKPMLYKVTGVWGNHEGSMLLWVLILTLFGALVAWFGQGLPPKFRARVLSVQAMIAVAFFAFVLLTSNPFLRIAEPPFDGRDLNPLLQDFGLAIHPPFLYLGYVGLSMTYSFAVAALIDGRVDAAWGRWVRPWTLTAWICLTIGIGLGSWWAYYELGWGGFWFWDPVENASFMPWLIAAALLHSAIVVEKRESLKSWTILLAIIAFGFSMIGAFITRSGVLTSVHAFANDPERGVFLLIILAVFMMGALMLFSLRAPVMQARGVFGLFSRESMLVSNNILLAVSAFVVFIGTIWPLVAELFFDRKLSVGPPFFNLAFTPFMIALGLLLPIGAITPWKRGRAKGLLRTLWPAVVVAIAVLCLIYAIQTGRSAMGPLGLALAAWLVAGAAVDLWARTNGRGFGRLWRLPGADWGKAVAHAGLGVTIAGVAGLLAWETEDIRVLHPGESFDLAGHTITLESVGNVEGANYLATQARLSLAKAGLQVATLTPERRFYPIAGTGTTEAAIHNGFLRDIYLALGEQQDEGWVIRSYNKPLANWIWGGAILMALGGLISLCDRRYRIATGARKVRA